MARIKKNALNITGSLGNLSAYHMKGCDDIVVRRKGGPTKKQIQTSPKFENTRRINAEFGGCSTTAKWVRQMLHTQRALADHNISGPLTVLLKPIAKLDTKHDWGKRNIHLSKNPRMLEGFNLNKENSFDSIVRIPPSFELSRDTLTAKVDIAEMLPGITLFTPGKHPLFGFDLVIGIIPDLLYTPHGYKPAGDYSNNCCTLTMSEWYPVSKGSPAMVLETALNIQPPNESFSVILSIGIRFGTIGEDNLPRQVKHTGSAKVIGMR